MQNVEYRTAEALRNSELVIRYSAVRKSIMIPMCCTTMTELLHPKLCAIRAGRPALAVKAS